MHVHLQINMYINVEINMKIYNQNKCWNRWRDKKHKKCGFHDKQINFIKLNMNFLPGIASTLFDGSGHKLISPLGLETVEIWSISLRSENL